LNSSWGLPFSISDAFRRPNLMRAFLVLVTLGIASAGCIEEGDGVQPSTPNVVLTLDETSDRLTVASAADGADWDRLAVSLDQPDSFDLRAGLNCATRDGPVSPGCAVDIKDAGTYVEVTDQANRIQASEFLEFCGLERGSTTGVARSDVKVTVKDTVSNKIMESWTFTSIAACSAGSTNPDAPTISWAADETKDRLSVNSASATADWYRLTVQVDSCTITPAGAAVRVYAGDGTATSVDKNEESDDDGAALGAASATTACGAPAAVRIGTATAKVTSGDYLDFCVGPASGTEVATKVKVTFVDTIANAVQHTHTFTNVARCP
jgi:hypothetical protein